MKNTYVAIMAGGIGSRFWPKSREQRPKQFIDILGTGKSLLRSTFDRFASFINPRHIYIVTHQRYANLVKDQLPGLPPDQIVAEPLRRNTAPCIAYVAHKLAALHSEANLVVAPSDHLITNTDNFKESVEQGLGFTSSIDALLTLGIQPSRPDTNYGYIQYYVEDRRGENIHKVKTFTEKPNERLARHFIESGDFLWNSGIFIWNVQSILKALKMHLPEMNEIFAEGKTYFNTDEETDFIQRAYSHCKNISIDYGVMEKADNVFVIPSNFGWSDLGTWDSLWTSSAKDYLGNAVKGKNVVVYDTQNSMIMTSDDKLVILQGLDDYCIIDTNDVLLVCKKSDHSAIQRFRDETRSKKGDRYL